MKIKMFEKFLIFSINKKEKGYVVISTTLIFLLVSVGIASLMSALSNGNSQLSFSRIKSEQALAWSDSCLQETLLRIKLDPLYAGGSVDFPKIKCHINVENQGVDYVVKTSFESDEKYSRAIESKIQFVDGKLKIISWEQKSFVVK